MAYAAGVMSLLLWFVELPVVYLLDNPDLAEKVKWIPFVHGYVYAFYVLAAIHFTARIFLDLSLSESQSTWS